ncbi:MAG: glucosaminidase domain-containing protein [Pseudomonadales bacterium]
MREISKVRGLTCLLGLFWLAAGASARAEDPEVVVLNGVESTIAWLESRAWWGEVNRSVQLEAPNALLTGIPQRWRTTAASLTVPEKKEAFYRFLLPLILHANDMVMTRRTLVEAAAARLAAGGALTPDEIAVIARQGPILRLNSIDDVAAIAPSGAQTEAVLAEILYKLDIIPAGLALGQAAYESGYGTSRFAAEGNALFGQWTFGGEGLKPELQRKELGDHRIAAFDWPFDSVRAYYINLMSHPAYDAFRRLRADLRASGQPLTSLALADGLIAYSERGQEYVDTLKGIIRVNGLAIADNAVLRDEPRVFLVGAESDEDAVRLNSEIDDLRRSGELAKIVERMNLE